MAQPLQLPHRAHRRSRGLTKENTAAGIYGVIVSAAVMAASHENTAVAVAVSVLFTLFVYWAAERYARLVAERLHDGRRPTWDQVRAQLTTGWEIVSASTLPLVVLVVMALLGADLSVAVLAALGCSTLLLALAGWEMGRDGRLRPLERVASAGIAALFGASMILLKALLH
jgi:hypothetical protein